MTTWPSIFVGHGSPGMILERAAARDFLSGLGRQIGKPKAILVATAHWETGAPAIGAAGKPETIHDFFGFPQELYRIVYPASGAPEMAARAQALLNGAGFDATLDHARGLDHGAWAPLYLMYPDADVPVAQISLQPHRGPGYHLSIGRALEPLREEGVLVMGSGAITHNLRDFGRWGLNDPPAAYAAEFDAWVRDAVTRGDTEAVVDYRARAPHAARNQPSEEHFLPLLVAMGAGGKGAKARTLHEGFTYGFLSMAAYAFD